MQTLIITTSREPSRRTRSFVNELVKVVPQSLKLVRGKLTLQDLASKSVVKRAYGVLIVFQKKANPSALVYHEINEAILRRKFLLRIKGIKLRREIPNSQAPLNIRRLVINPVNLEATGILLELVSAFIEIFRPELTSSCNKEDVELYLGGENEVTVNFICCGTGKVCGPQIKVFKVMKYDEVRVTGRDRDSYG